jgi:hypothetical protein
MWGGLFIATACVVSVQLVNFGAGVKISGRGSKFRDGGGGLKR